MHLQFSDVTDEVFLGAAGTLCRKRADGYAECVEDCSYKLLDIVPFRVDELVILVENDRFGRYFQDLSGAGKQLAIHDARDVFKDQLADELPDEDPSIYDDDHEVAAEISLRDYSFDMFGQNLLWFGLSCN